MKVSDLAYFNFNIFKQFDAQLRRVGNVAQNRDMGLSLLGGESHYPEAVDSQGDDETSQRGDKEADGNTIADLNHEGDRAPKNSIWAPTKNFYLKRAPC